jgi:hypothetical protein
MPPGRCLSLRGPPEHPRSGEGDDPAPPFPPDGGTRGTDACVAGRRARGRRRQQIAAGSPARTTTFTPRMKTTAATTVDGGARRTWSCARSYGNRGHRVGMKDRGRTSRSSPSSAPVASLSHWRRSPPPSVTGAEMVGGWRERSEGG